MPNLKKLLRPHLSNLKPYSSARDEYTGKAKVFLDANENALGSVTKRNLSRYPDPYQTEVKEKLSDIIGVPTPNIFLGNGSDEPIDLLFRAFCEPASEDHVILCPPTYGMYQVCADINNVKVKEVSLTTEYQLDVKSIKTAIDQNTKLIFICSPNNPTGNNIKEADILQVIQHAGDALVIVDEAYIDFSSSPSFVAQLNTYDNLLVLQTFSKSWGMAAARLGMAYAHRDIIAVLNQIKYPYNLSQQTQDLAIEGLKNHVSKNTMVSEILRNKTTLRDSLERLELVVHIYPSDANFFLVKVLDATAVYNYLLEKSTIVRDRSKVSLCENCLRITVGTQEENKTLLEGLKSFRLEEE